MDAARSAVPARRGRLHVGIDARCLNTDHLRGMGKYVWEMLTHLADEESLEWSLFGDRPNTVFHCPANARARRDCFEWRGYRFHSWEQLGLPLRAHCARVDLLHCAATTLPFWQPVPTVVTVHDTLPWTSIDAQKMGWYLGHLLPAALRRCRAIITISEASRRDVLALWADLSEKLYVVPHGVADSYFAEGPLELDGSLRALLGPREYLLYVGGSLERKRFRWALELLEQIKDDDLQLAACGFSKADARQAAVSLPACLRERVRFLPFVQEAHMPALYRHAIAVLYPTLYEGFGFPVVESQAVGTPVLFSALGSLAELQGPASHVLPAQDLGAWLETIQQLRARTTSSPVVNDAARRWARRFSWVASARRHAEIFDSAARTR